MARPVVQARLTVFFRRPVSRHRGARLPFRLASVVRLPCAPHQVPFDELLSGARPNKRSLGACLHRILQLCPGVVFSQQRRELAAKVKSLFPELFIEKIFFPYSKIPFACNTFPISLPPMSAHACTASSLDTPSFIFFTLMHLFFS